MKKSLIVVVGVVVSFGFAPLMATAATLSLSPANASATQGQNFTVNVALNPQSVANYTVKVELRYPANLLEVRSFTFSNGWIPLTQPGYDSIDNANGTLIKTAGYPGGASLPVTFGTVSFAAKGTGSGNIIVGTNSSAFNANSQNTLSGLPALVSVTVNAPASTSVPTPAPTPTPLGTPEEPAQSSESIAEGPPQSSEAGLGGKTFLAQVGSVVTLGTNKAIFGILFAAVALYAVYAVVKKVRRKKEGSGEKKALLP